MGIVGAQEFPFKHRHISIRFNCIFKVQKQIYYKQARAYTFPVKCFNNSNIITVIAITYISSNLHCLKLIPRINWCTFLQLSAESRFFEQKIISNLPISYVSQWLILLDKHCILLLIVHAPLFYTFSMHRGKGSKILILMSKVRCH